MSDTKGFRLIQNSKISSLEAKLEIYSKNIEILDSLNKKLMSENLELQRRLVFQLKEKDNTIEKLQKQVDDQDQLLKNYHVHSISSFKSEEKSELFNIISECRENTSSSSKIQELMDEFDDIEQIQNKIKSENVSAQKSLKKLEELYPSMHKISNLSQRLFMVFQSFLRGEQIQLSLLVSSPERNYKTNNVIEHYWEDINKTREVLEKTMQIIADNYAENYGSNECVIY